MRALIRFLQVKYKQTKAAHFYSCFINLQLYVMFLQAHDGEILVHIDECVHTVQCARTLVQWKM